jgi:hypothetical protein
MFPGRQRVLCGRMPSQRGHRRPESKRTPPFLSPPLRYQLSSFARLCEPLNFCHHCGEHLGRFPFLDYQYCGSKVWTLSSSVSHIPSGPPRLRMKPYAPDDPVLLYHAHLRPRHDSSTPTPGSSTCYTNTAIPSDPASSTNPPQPLSSIQIPGSSLSESGTMPGPLVFTTTFPLTTVTQPTTTFTSFTESIVTQYPSSPASSLSHSIPSAASAALSTQSLIQSRTGPLCPGDGFDSAAAGIIATVLIPAAIGLLLWVNRL